MSDQDFILVDEEDKERSTENNTEKNTGNNTGGEDGQPDRDAVTESPSAGTVKDEIAAAEKKEEDSEDEYEKICFICHRPESVTGKMIELPNHITVCPDCMQKSFDAMTSGAVDLNRLMNTPGIQFLNLSDLENMQPRQQKIKKKKEKPKEFHQLDIRKIPAPHKIKARLDEYVVGQEYAKKAMSVAVYNHYKRVAAGAADDIEIEKSNMLMIGPMQPRQQKIKKKKEKPKEFHQLDIRKIPAPHKIKARLDEYVVGQEYAKKAMSVAVYNHYKRVAAGAADDIEIEKSNMLMIGPTGSGKTYLVKTLARLLDVPLAITDATSLTEAGYIGDDIESVVSKLLAAADNDVEKAEQGIIFIDEIDKIAKKQNSNQRDVSGESVQQGMLKLLEGSDVEVPVGANSKNAMVPLTTVNTKNILFICAGAFPDLEGIIRERLQKKTSMGFNAELKDKYENDKDILSKVTVEDLRKFGMIPEFLGRLPIIFTLKGLDKDMLVKILKEPKNAILKQYQKLLALDEVRLDFNNDALEAIAEKAMKKDTGARALRAIIEEFMLDIMYEIPKDDSIGEVIITREYIEGTGGPVIRLRGQEMPLLG